MADSMRKDDLATEGNAVSTGFHKDAAVRCLLAALEHAGVDDKVLAAECRMSRGYFSKVASGQQGDLLALVYALPPHRASIRADFFARLADAERIDPVLRAAEQLTAAAIRFLRVRGEASPLRMARALAPDRKAKKECA